jgi:hypothetical protein
MDWCWDGCRLANCCVVEKDGLEGGLELSFSWWVLVEVALTINSPQRNRNCFNITVSTRVTIIHTQINKNLILLDKKKSNLQNNLQANNFDSFKLTDNLFFVNFPLNQASYLVQKYPRICLSNNFAFPTLKFLLKPCIQPPFNGFKLSL